MTRRLWAPDADRVEGESGGSMTGGPPRATWHSTEGSSIDGALAAYRDHNSWPTLTWDPTTGRIVQHLPADTAARSLENPPGGVETNRMGRIHVQIEVVAQAVHPFTDGPMIGFGRLLRWLDQLGIGRSWPAGRPLPYPESYGLDNGDRRIWAGRGGHYAHSQVPENHHGDPGHIDLRRWRADVTPKRAGHPDVRPLADYPPWPGLLMTGDKGADVEAWQRQLHRRGWRISVDASYGPQTESVTAAFQADKGLPRTGTVDRRTWRAGWTAPVT